MGNVFRERRFRGKDEYIQAHYDRRNGLSRINYKMFRETKVKERRPIHSYSMIRGKEQARILGMRLEKQG
jgi:hypothetical protein